MQVSSPQGRFRTGAAKLNGGVIERVDAYGKHLFYEWADSQILHIHLGLYGKFRNHPVPPPPPRGAVRMRVVSEANAFDLNGPTACEILTEAQYQRILDRLGPDPLRRDADPQQVWQRIQKSRAAIGALLLNQSLIAGVGNVYRAECLHARGIHPERRGSTLSQAEFRGLWETLVRMLQIGVKYNRIITTDPDIVGKSRGRMARAERLRIYKKEECFQCRGPVEFWELGARRIYACPTCQK